MGIPEKRVYPAKMATNINPVTTIPFKQFVIHNHRTAKVRFAM